MEIIINSKFLSFLFFLIILFRFYMKFNSCLRPMYYIQYENKATSITYFFIQKFIMYCYTVLIINLFKNFLWYTLLFCGSLTFLYINWVNNFFPQIFINNCKSNKNYAFWANIYKTVLFPLFCVYRLLKLKFWKLPCLSQFWIW